MKPRSDRPETTNVTLRLEPKLLRQLRRIAKAEGRSLNQQIVHEMKEYMHHRPGSASGAWRVPGRPACAAGGGRA